MGFCCCFSSKWLAGWSKRPKGSGAQAAQLEDKPALHKESLRSIAAQLEDHVHGAFQCGASCFGRF
eukprot:8569776-Prorocentrum_lima.AAC.1